MPKKSPARKSRPAPAKPGWLRSLLSRRVRLERRGLTVHVLLETPALEDSTAPGPSAGDTLRRAHAELGALLDRHPDARHLMRHLGYVEREIARDGSKAFRQVPVPVLRRAVEQLELLLRGQTEPTIAPLQQRLERALRERAAEPMRAAAPAVDVSEASHSLFDEMERSWTGQMPFEKTVPFEPSAPPRESRL
jgi:hypothetical protein